MSYPELEKLKAIQKESQTIGEFLDWLRSIKHYFICYWTEVETLQPVGRSIESLLAEYYEIDSDKVEAEKRMILDDFRNKAAPQPPPKEESTE